MTSTRFLLGDKLVMVGFFPYWLGVSYKLVRPYRRIDLGFLKIMWM